MVKSFKSLLCYLSLAAIVAGGQLPRPSAHQRTTTLPAAALESVLATGARPFCTLIFFMDGSTSATSLFMKLTSYTSLSSRVVMFEVAVDSQDANVTQAELSRVVDEARRLRHVSWCVTVAVVSDDPAFLASFAQWSLKGRLLVWSTRLLVVTRLPLPELHYLRKLLSMTNSMLLTVDNILPYTRCSMFIYLPYSPPESKALRVASWTPQRGLTLTTHLQLFPDKFFKFLERPTLLVAVDQNHVRETEGKAKDDLMNFLKGPMNFTYEHVLAPDNNYGSKQSDGSWSGLMGMVVRKEADLTSTVMRLTVARAEVVDFTTPITIEYSRILARRGRPEIDPWGFLFVPLAPLVWVAILTALLVLPVAMLFLSSCTSLKDAKESSWTTDTYSLYRILLQQDYVVYGWWWRRLVFAVWMMTCLVLVKSYAGTLMSVLAVRHIKQPFQTLQDVVDDPSTVMLWPSDSKNMQYIRSVETGMSLEVAEAESRGRIKYRTLYQFFHSVDTLVRRGDHVLIAAEILITMITGRDFSKTGRCDFYSSRERLLPNLVAPIGQKNSPLVPALSRRIPTVIESGLYYQWIKKRIPNATTCSHPPSTITVSSSFSFDNIWGMFVVLLGGHALAFLALCTELIRSQTL